MIGILGEENLKDFIKQLLRVLLHQSKKHFLINLERKVFDEYNINQNMNYDQSEVSSPDPFNKSKLKNFIGDETKPKHFQLQDRNDINL